MLVQEKMKKGSNDLSSYFFPFLFEILMPPES